MKNCEAAYIIPGTPALQVPAPPTERRTLDGLEPPTAPCPMPNASANSL